MTTVPLTNFDPGSPEWMKRMTASKVAAVLGLSPWESRFSLWHRMAGLIEPVEQTDEMSRGHYLEPGVAAWFADKHPEMRFMPGKAWAHPERDWQAASPDRLILQPGDKYGDHPVGALEVKTSLYSDEWGEPGTDEIPPYYRAQVVWQMDTLGLPVAHVAVLLMQSGKFAEYRIDYNPAEAAELVAEARAFLDSLPGGPAEQRPNLDGHAETYAAVRRLHPDIDPVSIEVPPALAREYCAAVNGLKAAKTREAMARVQIADHMATAKTAFYLTSDERRMKLADRRAKNGGDPYVQAASNLSDDLWGDIA